MDATSNKLTSFSGHLDDQYGKPGTVERDQYEKEFEAFKLAAMDPLFLPTSVIFMLILIGLSLDIDMYHHT